MEKKIKSLKSEQQILFLLLWQMTKLYLNGNNNQILTYD